MRTINHILLISCLSAGIPIMAAEPTAGAATNATTSAADATNTPVTSAASAAIPDQATNSVAGTNAVIGTNALAAVPAVPSVVVENGTNGVRLNFHNAPLNLVLDYLSDAAGFVINKETDVRGTVDVQGKDLTKDEAVEVLNSALKKNGCAVVRIGRILTIVAQDTAKTRDLEIVSGNDPDTVEKGNEVVTQIIPVR